MMTRAWACAGLPGLLIVAAIVATVNGCGGGLGSLGGAGFTGGGLPPGPLDIGGVVVRESTEAPVGGAEIVLVQDSRTLGRARTGPDGYFRFVQPVGGTYTVRVAPPTGSGLHPVIRRFHHPGDRRSFLIVALDHRKT